MVTILEKENHIQINYNGHAWVGLGKGLKDKLNNYIKDKELSKELIIAFAWDIGKMDVS